MAYTSEVIRRASQLLERRRTALKSQQRALRAEVYERIPEVRAIDGRLRAGMLALTAAALDHGTDPAPGWRTSAPRTPRFGRTGRSC